MSGIKGKSSQGTVGDGGAANAALESLPAEVATDSENRRVQPQRTSICLKPDSGRVVLKPFLPESEDKTQRILRGIVALSQERAAIDLGRVFAEFEGRHRDLEGLLSDSFRQVRHLLPEDYEPTWEHRLLIGAYFIGEYALESAALFNPSIVPHPDQSGVSKNSLRVVLSLRATGEGHISSIEFRCGMVDGEGNINIDPAAGYVTTATHITHQVYEKAMFRQKLLEIDVADSFTARIMDRLGPRFAMVDLEESIKAERAKTHAWGHGEEEIAEKIRWLAHSNYEIHFDRSVPLSQRIVFPVAPIERQGIEDARFVLFEEDSGKKIYYATYTAWDGDATIPQLLETSDFGRFRMSTLNGKGVRNKGMALFPRCIGGRYAMLSRMDSESMFLMYSDNVHFWHDAIPLAKPVHSWELNKIGNCGSPVETPEGWLVLTHGVGPMRKYCIGAMLLDLDDPSIVIGRLREPLIEPMGNEREGYVPNVVYTCGFMVHAGRVIIPYAMSDYATTVATVDLEELLAALR